jgi:hypothetical protein
MTGVPPSGSDDAGQRSDSDEPISLERRCQVAGCSTVFVAPALDELRCPSCRRAKRRVAPGGQSLYGCTAARCAGV